MKPFKIVLLLLSVTFTFKVEADVVITNDKNIEFIVSQNGQLVEVPNEHKGLHPRVKFSFRGASVKSVQPKSGTLWHLELSDGTTVHISRNETTASSKITKHYVEWPQAGSNANGEICFHYGFNDASWYNTYQQKHQRWPMDHQQRMAKYAVNAMYYDWQLEVKSFFEHLFLNSDGFALLLDQQSPLFLQFDPNNGDPLMCISAHNTTSPYGENSHDQGYRDLKFSLFAGENVRDVYEIVTNQLGHIHKPTSIPDERLFTHTSWICNAESWKLFPTMDSFNQTTIKSFAQQILDHGYGNGVINLDWDWQNDYLTFAPTRFPEPKALMNDLHQMGFRASLYIHPKVRDYARFSRNYFVQDKSENLWPIVDFTKQEAFDWFVGRLQKIQADFSVDSFQFTTVWDWIQSEKENELYRNLTDLDDTFAFSDTLAQKYPAYYTEKYTRLVSKFGSLAVARSGFKTQDMSVFVRTFDSEADWSHQFGLKSMIPTVLALSIGGYSFIIPDTIGGRNGRASEELYIRWLQASTFMPAMQFQVPPWDYSDRVAQIAKKFVDLHISHAATLIELARKRVRDGTPIIRPMWYVAPNDANTFDIDDQFMVGDDLLVAPVLEQGAVSRLVYLPEGTWIDQRGRHYGGPIQVTVAAPLDELPYFRRDLFKFV